MFTPVVTEFVEHRSVSFPNSSNWFDYQTGRLYKGGSVVAVQNRMTEAVPIFIRGGYGVMSQNTTNITKTSQLGNTFTLKAGMAPKSSDNKTYESRISMLSIQDFNDDGKVTTCIQEGCLYVITAALTISSTARSLELAVVYSGSQRLNEVQVLNRVELFYDGGSIVQNLDSTVTISGTGTIIIPLKQQG